MITHQGHRFCKLTI